MAFYDIFNGDADGICALHQLRLATARAAQLITGAKRDIRLVARVDARAGDELTVLDISYDTNREGVARVLAAGASVRYFDHHYAGEIREHAQLEANIDTASDVCTSLIVDRALAGRFRSWAVVAAFGDNLAAPATRAAEPLGLAAQALEQLRELGECINYNAYGESVDDLHYHPADLYRALGPYSDPLEFIAGEPVLDVLRQGMVDDLDRASELAAHGGSETHALVVLPDAAWSRRVSGTLGNRLARKHPQCAHAVLTTKADGGFVVSVRAPIADPSGADTLCRQFETGGGRSGAAGIDRLPAADLDRFARAFAAAYSARAH